MKARFVFSMITALLFSLFSGTLLGNVIEVNPFAVSTVIFAASFIPKPAGIMSMALDVEMWKPWIVEQLFAGNDFLNAARNADEHVLQGKVVHIPNAGDASAVEKNRTSLPASITKRTDIDVSYLLDEYTSNPRLIVDADKILSYDKMSSAMGQDMRAIKDLIAKWMLYNWLVYSASRGDTAAVAQIETSGASTAAHLTGATGNRKKFKLDELKEAQARMDDNNMPENERYAIASSRMIDQLTDQLTVSDYRDFSKAFDIKKGVIGELFGFKIYKRSSVIRFNNAATKVPKEPGTANATTDNDAVICWQRDEVERAIGTVKIFENLNDPTYYGNIYSLLVRAGGRRVRADGTGMIAIVQKAA